MTHIVEGFSPDRLWSLWDIMKKFSVEEFFHVVRELGRLSSELDNDQGITRAEDHVKTDLQFLDDWNKMFVQYDLRVCSAYVSRIKLRYSEHESSKVLETETAAFFKELAYRIEEECGLRTFISVTDDAWKFYAPKKPLFGEQVEDKIPTVIGDISEAGNCLGLGRPTACVFHLMRVMEIGVQVLGKKLGVPLANEKNWQNILDQINARISALSKGSRNKTKYAAIAAHLFNVKLAWRNEVMHPKATHTLEEAEAIFFAVKNYMKDLIQVL